MCPINTCGQLAGILGGFLTGADDFIPFLGETEGQSFRATITILHSIIAAVVIKAAPGWGTNLVESAFSQPWSPGASPLLLTFDTEQRLQKYEEV